MATREEIGLALDVIKQLNSMGRGLRASAQGFLNNQNARIQAIIDDGAAQTKLINGLSALNVSVAALQSDKSEMVSVCNYILANIDEITEL